MSSSTSSSSVESPSSPPRKQLIKQQQSFYLPFQQEAKKHRQYKEQQLEDNHKIIIVKRNEVESEEIFYTPRELVLRNDHVQHQLNNTASSQSTIVSTTSLPPNSQSHHFVKSSQLIDFTKKYFDHDLNIAFANDPKKFLGEFPSNQLNVPTSTEKGGASCYAVTRRFITAQHSLIKIYHTRFTPINLEQPVATIIVVHGFCEHSGLYINFADYFARSGYEVHLYDQRGFGYTGGVLRNSSQSEFHEDFRTIVSLTRNDIPRYVFAHSTGALGVLSYLITNPPNYAGKHTFAGLISLNAFLRIPKYYKLTPIKKVIVRFLGWFYNDLLINSRLNLSALCKNSYHIKKIICDDHMSQHLTIRMANGLIDMCSLVSEQSSKITTPILLLHGKLDAVSRCEDSLNLCNSVSSQNKQIHLLEDGYHQPHLDTNSHEVHQRIANWINSTRSPATNSPAQQRLPYKYSFLNMRRSSSSSTAFQPSFLLNLLLTFFRKKSMLLLLFLFTFLKRNRFLKELRSLFLMTMTIN